MGMIASQITSLTVVYSTVYSGVDQRKHQSSTSLAFVQGIHPWPVNSPHKWPVTRKMIPFDDVIMYWLSGMYFYMNKQLRVMMQLIVLRHGMISNNTYQLHIHYISKDREPISLMMFQCDLNFMENYFSCNVICNDLIPIYFVHVMWASMCSDILASNRGIDINCS